MSVIAGASEPATIGALICVDPAASLTWKTINSASADVALDWPDGAISATILIDGKESASTSDTTVDTIAVPFSLPMNAASERIVTVQVSYRDGADNEMVAATAMLGLVAGTQSGDAVSVKDRSSRGTWSRSPVRRPVVPVPANVADAMLGGEAVSMPMDAPGWTILPLSGNGDLLAAAIDGNPFAMTVGVRKALTVTVR